MKRADSGQATVEIATSGHEPHPDCPDSLACLSDTSGRPQHTLPVILRCAILGSPHKRLTLREIYAAMENKYSYYKTAGPTWKQSVRHHLSLNRLFERQPRLAADPGYGSYWTVNLAAPTGTKRPRKRGRPNRRRIASGLLDEDNRDELCSPELPYSKSMLRLSLPSLPPFASLEEDIITRMQGEMDALRSLSLALAQQLADAQAEVLRAGKHSDTFIT